MWHRTPWIAAPTLNVVRASFAKVTSQEQVIMNPSAPMYRTVKIHWANVRRARNLPVLMTVSVTEPARVVCGMMIPFVATIIVRHRLRTRVSSHAQRACLSVRPRVLATTPPSRMISVMVAECVSPDRRRTVSPMSVTTPIRIASALVAEHIRACMMTARTPIIALATPVCPS